MNDSFLYISGGACGRSWETRSVFQAIVENAAPAFVTSSQPSPNPNATRAARASRVFHNRGSVHRPYPLAQIRSQETTREPKRLFVKYAETFQEKMLLRLSGPARNRRGRVVGGSRKLHQTSDRDGFERRVALIPWRRVGTDNRARRRLESVGAYPTVVSATTVPTTRTNSGEHTRAISRER